MNQAAANAIARLFDAFPQSAGNPDLTLDTFDRILEGVSDQIIIDTVTRFLAGDVADQSLRFAPSIAEFNREARRIADLRSYAGRPQLPAPVYRSTGGLPFEIRAEKARHKFRDWDVFDSKEHGVPNGSASLEKFRSLWKAGHLPIGSTWSAALGTIFIPRRSTGVA